MLQTVATTTMVAADQNKVWVAMNYTIWLHAKYTSAECVKHDTVAITPFQPKCLDPVLAIVPPVKLLRHGWWERIW